MKLLLILLLFITACNNADRPSTALAEKDFKVIIFDGCEYIVYEHGNGKNYTYSYSITHKGNCSNHH